jgi:hypothetical protein
MNKLVSISLVAALICGSALAEDKPNSITANFSTDRNTDRSTTYTPNITYQRDLGNGFQFGLQTESAWTRPHKPYENRVEIDGYYQLPSIIDRVTLTAGAGIGREKVTPSDFPYYSLYGNADYSLTDSLTWNAVQYQYRDAFNGKYNFASNQIGTGLTYKFNASQSVSLSVYQSSDAKWKKQSNGMLVGYTYSY